jgi:hypothetical protein
MRRKVVIHLTKTVLLEERALERRISAPKKLVSLREDAKWRP